MTQDELLRLIDEAAADGRPTLDLAGKGLNELPPEIGKLTKLKTLVLGKWNKGKVLGNNFEVLPDELGKLVELRCLNLYKNQFFELPKVLAKLRKLAVLVVQGNQLTTLPNWIGTLTNLKRLQLKDNQLSSLPDTIGQLSQLCLLNISYNRFSIFPEIICECPNLQSLDISYNDLSTLSHIVGQLSNLKSLDLSQNKLHDLPEIFSQLSTLQSLSLSGNKLDTLPFVIGQLRNLKSFEIRANQLSYLPEFIGQLSNLQSLNLSFNRLITLPESIGQLSRLQSIDLSQNRLNTLSQSIGQLSSLQSLNLSFNQLESLSESVGQLLNLQSLGLSYNQISELPKTIGQLVNLKILSLNGNKIHTLPNDFEELHNLQSLGLNYNCLTTSPKFIGQLSTLRVLYLSGNRLSKFPETVRNLPNLIALTLWGNKISQLPSWIHQLSTLETLDIRANRLPIPPEVLGSKDQYDNPAAAKTVIDYYFQEKSEIPLYEAKFLIVGEGEAGKTTLAKKLQDPKYKLQKDEKSTEGIEVLPYKFDHPDGNLCKVNIWDFGGQEIYHATHQFFLTERAVYALVTDSRKGNTDFYFWLNVIQLHGGDSPVIIIKNEKNDRPCAVPDLQLRGQFKNLQESIEVNLADNRNLETVQTAIQKHITSLSHVSDPLIKTWSQVRSILENQALGSDNYISIQDYRQICSEQGIPNREEQDRLSNFLHDLGVFLHFQSIPQLAKTIFLTPAWSTDAVYKVLDTPKVRKDCGRFSNEDLNDIWQDNQYADVRSELLALMREFEVCYEITGRKHHYIAPHLLEANLPEHLQYHDSWDTHNNLTLTYHYPFKPKNIFPRFIVALHRYIEKQRLVWKHGVILIIGSARAEIIEDARYDAANINIRISGSDKKRALAIIGHELERIHSSFEKLTYQTLIPCNCSECTDSQEPYKFSYDVLQKSLRKNNFDIQCQNSFKMVNVRRLIDDVIEPSQAYEKEGYDNRANILKSTNPKESAQSPFNTTYQIVVNHPEQKYEESNDITVGGDVNNASLISGKDNTVSQSSQTNQHATGDNIAGDKIKGDKINTQINHHQEITEISEKLDAIIEDLCEEYNPEKPRGQANIQRDALATVSQNTVLKQRITKALKAGLEETLEQTVKYPLAKVLIKSCKGFLEGK